VSGGVLALDEKTGGLAAKMRAFSNQHTGNVG
jgi:hypothetical protein